MISQSIKNTRTDHNNSKQFQKLTCIIFFFNRTHHRKPIKVGRSNPTKSVTNCTITRLVALVAQNRPINFEFKEFTNTICQFAVCWPIRITLRAIDIHRLMRGYVTSHTLTVLRLCNCAFFNICLFYFRLHCFCEWICSVYWSWFIFKSIFSDTNKLFSKRN